MSLPFVFFGTPEFAVAVLDTLQKSGKVPRAVVCQPDRPAGRGRKPALPPAKVWAQAWSVPVLQPERLKDESFLTQIRELLPALALVAAFGKILRPGLLEIPTQGFINVHPSILPRYRGAAPIQWTLINGDEMSGVTILKVTPRLDDGEMILQKTVAVGPNDNAEALGARLGTLGGELAAQALDLFERGAVVTTPQDGQAVIWARALEKEDGRIDWNQPVRSVHNRIRGVQPWPGAYTSLDGRAVKVYRAEPEPAVNRGSAAQPGQVLAAQGADLLVATADGLLRLLEVQLEGKKRLPVREFLLGRPVRAGDLFS